MTTTVHDPASSALLGGRYELLAVLGAGGMAQVHRARDRVLDRHVAVKMLRATTTGAEERARFVAEARILASLSHSGLVTVLDAGLGLDDVTASLDAEEVAQPFVVMELVEGPTLARLIAQGPLPVDRVTAIGVEVAEALAYVHAHGVVHRDVKPGNVLTGEGNRVKLADFGIARLLDDVTRHTDPGQAIGTAAYLAPEQVTSGEVTGAADIYSLGLILLEAMTGRREYPGTPMEAAVGRLHRSPRVPRELAWRDLLVRMTEKDPRKRPTGDEVAQQLREHLASPVPLATQRIIDTQSPSLLGTSFTKLMTTVASAASGWTSGAATSAVPTSAAEDTAPWTPPHERYRTLRGYALYLSRRFRALASTQRLVAETVAGAVLVATLVGVVALSAGHHPNATTAQIPGNTPATMRQPLQELHEAIDGSGG